LNLRRVFFWILLIFTLFVVYKTLLDPLLERLLRDTNVAVVAKVADDKFPKPQGAALGFLIYFVWRIYKWSKPERIQEEKIEQEIEERIERQRVQKKIIEKQKIAKERVGKNGYTKLMYLSGYGEIDEIRNQLSLSSADINEQDISGYTALMYATSSGHLEVVELLIGMGADKELMTKKGSNALFFAKNNSQTEIISILQSESITTDRKNSSQISTNHLGESVQTSSTPIEEKITDFEKRLNYKPQLLSDEEQSILDAKFLSASRTKKWPE